MATGWKYIDGNWYYFNSNGTMATGWVQDEGEWRYLNDDGKMAKGWVQDGDNWYCLKNTGKMATGWIQYDGDWYYFNPNGTMVTGWVQDEGEWRYLNDDGKMAKGWVQDGDNWYYIKSNGTMATGWMYIDGVWYYFHSDGSMATGWVRDGNVWHFMYNNGSMAYDYTDDGYHVDSTGKMVTGTGWNYIDGSWYYFEDDGRVATGWLQDEGNWYYLYPQGSMAHDTTINGWQVDDSGKWITDDDSTDESSDDIITLIKHFDSVAQSYGNILDLSSPNRRVLNLLRYYKYGNSGKLTTQLSWFGTLGDDDSDFVADVYGSDEFGEIYPYIQVSSTEAIIHGKKTDLPHLAATTLGYYSSPLVPDFWTGWGGDLATAMSDVLKLISKGSKKTAYELATEVIGDDLYTCPRLDIEADIDSIKIATMLDSDTVGNILDNYFQTVDGDSRREILFESLGFSSMPTVEELNDKIYELMTGPSGFGAKYRGWSLEHLAKYNGCSPSDEVINAITLAFSEYILNDL
ncbi:putative endo-beta-N-acetylglucosaminidase precursor [Clostridium saccharobutylicum]|uniref:Putative endo-beta-N-acetylglucosaminidase n=2 Tax=Clostridium saccharobutylicum TaxID=169679 RepID=A0A1S8NCG6_CLOSA|nr:putative endo-beta-N-acetylglucosaminidase precursor [Clostridium saccharobutylicum]